MVEVTVALALLMILGVLIAQAIVWGLQERARAAAHQAALELAANVLEAARAEPWEKLDKGWADAQQAPSDMGAVLPDARLAVTVTPEPKLPECRRVTVEVRWQFAPQPVKSVELTTLLSRRETKKAGGTP
jgi:type II secretory pathway pseudopilin PulG